MSQIRASRNPIKPIYKEGDEVFKDQSKILEINWDILINLINVNIKTIFAKKNLQLTDLRRIESTSPKTSVVEFTDNGIPFLNALILRTLTDDQFEELKVTARVDPILDSDIKAGLGILILFLIFRGCLPGTQQFPIFISSYFNIDKTQSWSYYANVLASFELGILNFDWIRKLNGSELPMSIKDRMMKGIAGYRLINLITENESKCGKSGVIEIRDKLIKIRKLGVSWELHPLTKMHFKSFADKSMNKLLSDLILMLYTKEEIEQFVRDKKLFKFPVNSGSNIGDFKFIIDLSLNDITVIIPLVNVIGESSQSSVLSTQ